LTTKYFAQEQDHLVNSELNFETLRNLKEKIGIKKFNGQFVDKKTQPSKFNKRYNKNRYEVFNSVSKSCLYMLLF
jgi:hypothetical protein